MKRILLLLVISNLVYGQDFKTVPDVFDKQCKTSFIKSIESETISLDNLKSRSQRYWIVYSDRDDNSFYSNHHSNSTNNKNASFMQGFYVKNTSGGWLHLVDVLDEIDYGWIHSKNLLLSIYSLKTEGDIEKGTVSIPRKSVILTSIDEARNVGGVLQTQKRYYTSPNRKNRYEKGTPKSFQPLFVFKETGTSVLLGGSDVLDGSVETNKSKIYGWINVSDKTDWDTRVALEDAQSSVALEEYSSSKLNGYITQNEITTCVEENLCDSKKSIAQFSVGPTRNNVMRRPVIQNIDHNIKKVISVAKDNKGNKVYEALLTEARRLQSNVNIVFVLDATASMRPYYKSIANSLAKVIDNNQKIIKSNLKLGVVVYRDYADGKSAYDVQPLTTDFNKVKKVINSTVCQSKDKDLPEAQFNGLINGIEEVGFNADESNIIVLIGDCGNHIDDKNGYAINNIIDLYGKYKTNLISFQVKSGADNSFYTFNEDVMDVIFEVANKKIEGKGSDLKIKLESKNNNTIKLKMIKGDEPDYENMFGLLVYSGNEPSSPKLLESTIENTLKEY
ncbi:MAG: type VI secretion system protein TssR domain-containing protein, partial [Flavobacteriales bacterium]